MNGVGRSVLGSGQPNQTERAHTGMPTIPFENTGFPATFAPANGNGQLTTTWSALIWAAISVGRAELLHIFRHGEYSLFEIAYRAAIIFANLRDDGAGRLRRSDAYDGLDPSEKSAISYFIGLTVAKAFADECLDVPWLMHLDVYRQQLQAQWPGRSRPDLVGQTTSGGWVALEAKGRTNGHDPAALQAAKTQVQQLSSVGGQQPVLRVGMVTHFGNGRLQFVAEDPPSRRSSRDRFDIPLKRAQLLEGYYRPFRTWLERDPRAHERDIDGVLYRAAPVESVGLEVGLEEDLMHKEGDISPRERRSTEGKYYSGGDGVIVIPGPLWSHENMMREPQERTSEP